MKIKPKHLIPIYGAGTYAEDYFSKINPTKEDAKKFAIFQLYHQSIVVLIIVLTAYLGYKFG